MKLLVKNIHTLAGVEYEPKLRLKGKEMAQTSTISNALRSLGAWLTVCLQVMK